MSEVTDTLGQAGPGELVEALGRTWSLAHVGPGIRARFSAWCKLRARQELLEQKPHLAEDAYREALGVLQEEMAAGAYNWGSPLSQRGMGSAIAAALRQDDGRIALLQVLLEPAHGLLPWEQVLDLMEANPEGIALAMAACLSLPNSQAPVTAARSPGQKSTPPTSPNANPWRPG